MACPKWTKFEDGIPDKGVFLAKSKQNEIKLYPYRDQWAKAYSKEKKIIERELGGFFFEIEHIGSTAVPDMSSTLVIDILIAVDDLADIEKFEAGLTDMGYTRSDISHGSLHRLFVCDSQQGFHIHFLQAKTLRDTSYLRFRDELINNPRFAKEFKELKIKLVGNYRCDFAWYTTEKSKWIRAKLKELAK